jgi:hypothetical protein
MAVDQTCPILLLAPDEVLLRICAGATNELPWQVLHRLVVQEWCRLQVEQAAILQQPAPPAAPLVRWYADLTGPGTLIPEPATRDTRGMWQGSKGIPEAASVLERPYRQAAIGKKSAEPAVDELDRILDEGGTWREMTPPEEKRWAKIPNYRERRARRQAEVEAMQTRGKPVSNRRERR